ncbi:hypothetical protein EGW08_014241 [Elysia chlorotica]|uniref:Tektin n=1 Tax=Elysia chlorotica TaxID=188477 RepID=A0A433T8Z4_ELYCH|nr:hypothetical protein EGW08_014241 [Elysia chlorotica]
MAQGKLVHTIIRTCLLQVVQGTAAATQARYEEYTSRIDSCVQAIKHKKENCEETFVCDAGPEGDVGLDTESCHMVKQACEHIGDLIHCSLETEAKSAQLEMRKSDAIDKVESAVAVYSSQALLRALSMNAHQAAAALRQKTSTLDISKDAQEISFSYTPREGLHDLSSPPSTADTVKRLLQTSCEQHVLRWFKEQEHRNDEWKLSSRHTETMAQIDKLLVRVIGDHPAHLESAKSFVLAQIGRAEEQAVAPCLRRELVQLSERVAEAQSNRDELQCKYARIQDFQALVSRKQASISQLAKLNAAAPERLQSHRQQVSALP